MKQESKEILDYLINEHSKTIGNYDGFTEQNRKYNEREMKIYHFLKSIPEIESHLCRGGYIQDENGTPCCDGDKVIYDENYEGFLRWDKNKARFYIASIYGDYTFDKIKSFVKYKG